MLAVMIGDDPGCLGEKPAPRSADPFIRAWRGQEMLPRVFWFYGVLGSCIFIGAYLGLARDASLATRHGILLSFGVYTFWAIVSIWRSADVERSIFHLLARALAVAWAANAALVVGALEVELIAETYRESAKE